MADFFYDLAGADPIVKDLIYNSAADADGDTITYRGAWCKVHDYDDIADGRNVVSIRETTVSENILGIVMEQVAATTESYLLNTASATGYWQRKKILVNPNAVYLMEYARKDAAGTACTDTGLVIAAAGTASTTCPNIGVDLDNGGWFYMLDGSAAGELHQILNTTGDNDGTDMDSIRSAMTSATASGDTFLVINPPFDYSYLLNDTKTDIKSELVGASRTDRFVGIDYWMKAPGWPFQKLDASKHDGLIIDNARFFHEVAISKGYLSGVHTLA